jgi:hypothetical protein
VSVKLIAEETGLGKNAVHRILTVQRVQTDTADNWVPHHDNVPAHTALSIRELMVKKNIPVLPYPPNSPDLALCDFYLFPKLKSNLKGHNLRTNENIQTNCNQMSYTHLRKITSSSAMISGRNGTTV